MAGHQLTLLKAEAAPIRRSRTSLVASGLDLAMEGQVLQVVPPGQEPIAFITAALREAPSDELHLVAHGAAGQIELGSGIDRAALLAHAAEIGGWGVERIYLWSCRVGADQAFTAALEELSGASVIASAEALGLGKSLTSSGFTALREAVTALPIELATTVNINFEDIYNPLGMGESIVIPNGYTGLNWSGFYTMNGPLMGNGWNVGAVSGPTVGYFGPGNSPASFKAPGTETFTLNSLTITTAYTYQYVDIKGYLDGVQTTPTFTADIWNREASTITLNWSNIDEVRFQNTRQPPYNQEALLDNITLTLEPQNTSLGTLTVAAANSADANPFNLAITGTISEGTIASLSNLTGTGNAYSITVTDSSVSAAALNTLDGKTTVAVNAASVGTLTGTAAAVTSALDSSGITGLGNEAVILSDTTLAAAALNTLDTKTSGQINAGTVTTLTGSTADLTTTFNSTGATGISGLGN